MTSESSSPVMSPTVCMTFCGDGGLVSGRCYFHCYVIIIWFQHTLIKGNCCLNTSCYRCANLKLMKALFYTLYKYFGSKLSANFLINRPGHPMYRRIQKGHLRFEDYKLPDHHLEALIIIKSTFLPNIIISLLLKDPYKYNQQQERLNRSQNQMLCPIP